MSRVRRSSFVVRVVEDRQGPAGGVIERVATGAKATFTELEAIGRVIGEMLRDERPVPGAGLTRSPDETSGIECPQSGRPLDKPCVD